MNQPIERIVLFYDPLLEEDKGYIEQLLADIKKTGIKREITPCSGPVTIWVEGKTFGPYEICGHSHVNNYIKNLLEEKNPKS